MKQVSRAVAVLALVALAAVPFAWPDVAHAAQSQAVTLHHVHGLAYSADGKQIFIPSHYGLAVYGESRWSKAPAA